MSLQLQKSLQPIIQEGTIQINQIQPQPISLTENHHKLTQHQNNTTKKLTDQNQQDSSFIQQNSKVQKWMNRQKLRYLIFLTFYQKQLQDKNYKPTKKWQSIMSEIIGDPDEQSCRIHQRTFLQRFKSIEGIINYFKISVTYKIQNMPQQIKRAVNIINEQQNKKQKEIYQLFEKKLTSEKYKIIKHESINEEVIISIKENKQKDKKIFTEECQNSITQKIIVIPVEFLIILKRQTFFRNIDQIKQNKLIDQCVGNFKDNKERVYKRKILRFKNKKTIKTPNLKIQNKIVHNLNLNDTQLFSQESPSVSENQIINKVNTINNHNLNEQKNIKVVWKREQFIRLIIFLSIMNEYRQKQHLNQIPYLAKKCSQYMNTDKSFNDCRQKIFRLRKKHGTQFWNKIDKQAEKLSIPESLIEKEKQKYFYYLNHPPPCQIKIQCKPLKQSQSQQFNSFKLHENITFDFKSTEQKMIDFNSNQQSIEKDEKVKQIVHIQLSNQIFEICKKSLKNTLYKRLNYILLVRKTQQVIQIENHQ